MNRRSLVAVGLLATAVPVAGATAQDVEALGRAYGTRPPDAYFRARDGNPRAFEFSRGWRARSGAPLLVDAEGAALPAAPPRVPLGEREGGIVGTLAFPLVLGLFSDSPTTPPHSRDQIQTHFFDGPNATGTIPDYYAEQSHGLLSMVGVAYPWERSSLSRAEVAGGTGGLTSPGRTGEFIFQILTAVDDGSVDWGQFDNDGPDGMPNSGDDDGYVDVLAVMHPTAGAECTGNLDRIWSHRWQLRFARGSEYVTRSASSSTLPGAPDRIRVNDYTIQPAASCTPGLINEIGVFAHELGHGLGLPDLYDTFSADGQHGAAGRWDLMATGSWGCRGGNPARPCHLGAWSKAMLGWVDVETLVPDADHGTVTLEPVETAARVLRVESGDGANEYYLLENRSRVGFDEDLFGEGLLVWQVDQDVVDSRWSSNTVNVDADRMGVWLRAADGLDQGARDGDNRGDGGDIFPGTTGNTAFHAGSNPRSYSHQGRAAGLTLLDIERDAADVRFRALTRFQNLTIRAGGTGGLPITVLVDGGAPQSTELAMGSAPFQTHTIEAGPGGLVEEGVRAGFLAWEDGSPRIREYTTATRDSVLVATYGGDREVLLQVSPSSSVEGIDPGQLDISPTSIDGWYDEGVEVSITAMARTGFSFREWSGDLDGAANPLTLVMAGPVTAAAEYDVTFGVAAVPASVPLEAATSVEVTLNTENANLPVTWSLGGGLLPEGLVVLPEGIVRGVPLDAGAFSIELLVRDAIGLEAAATLVLEVGAPNVGTTTLTAPFLSAGPGPTPSQLQYLDRHGNANGAYDLGDFRAFVLANPGLSPRAAAISTPGHVQVTVPLRPRPGGEVR